MTIEEETQKCFDFLSKNNLGVLATVDSEGIPRASTVYYAVDQNFNFYFSTSTKTTKYSNIMQNPDVSFVVGVKEYYITVQTQGKAIELQGSERKKYAELIVQNANRSGQHWPAVKDYEKQKLSVFKIIPTNVRMFDSRKQFTSATKVKQEGFVTVMGD